MNEITSRDNQHLKFARSVRDGRENGLIFIEGSRLVAEAARSEILPNKCFVTNSFAENIQNEDMIKKFIDSGTEVFCVPDTLLKTIADTENPQGIIVIAQKPENSRETIEQSLARFGLVVLLYEINNPSNLGAVIRTAEAAGATGVITTSGSADAFSPKSLRSSMGSGFRLPVWEGLDMNTVFEWAAKFGLRTTALDISGSNSIYDTDWQRQRLLIVGSEAHGLENDLLAAVDDIVTIPMTSSVESLNLAVSCGITLFEARRQISMS